MHFETGRLSDLLKTNRGWFIGKFMENPNFNTSNTENFEAKWGTLKKGDIHNAVVEDPKNTTSSFAIIIDGKAEYTVSDKKVILNKEDYVFYKPNFSHKVVILEDTVVLTIRWYEG